MSLPGYWIDTDNLVETTVTDSQTGAAVAGAAVSAELYRRDEDSGDYTAVDGSSIDLGDDGGGDYSGSIPSTITLTEGERVFLRIFLQSGVDPNVKHLVQQQEMQVRYQDFEGN